MAESVHPKKVKIENNDTASQQLLKKLRHVAMEKEQRTSLSGDQLHQSVREWENAKHTLTEIQQLLLQAYKDLELMQPSKK